MAYNIVPTNCDDVYCVWMVLEAYMYVSCELRRCLHPQSIREVQTLLRTRLVASYQPLLWCKVAVSTRTWPVGNSKPTNIGPSRNTDYK